MWASNFPVEKLMCPAADQIENRRRGLQHLTDAERDMVFRGTATRVYRIV